MSGNKANRSSQRRGRQMAKTNKTISTNRSDDHMGRERQLRIDSRKQRETHTNKVRKDKDLEPIPADDPALKRETPDDVGPRTLEEEGDYELVSEGNLIVGLRAYDGTQEGLPCGRPVKGEEFCAIHRRIRREREYFRELNGQMVRVGDESVRYDATGTRSNLTRKVPGVLKSIMVRLMPHEANALTDFEKWQEKLGEAMDATVIEYEKATGCEVVTAAAHRMSRTDCHVHIQYTMVQAVTESKHMLGRRLKPWKQLAVKMAKEALAAEGMPSHGSAAIRAKKKQLIADGKLSPPPEAGIEFRKFPGLRDLGDGAILGYSFRQKLNLVRAAEAGRENELAKKVTDRNDERFGRFAPIASRSDTDLDAKYLDLWLERVWRRNVTAHFPEGRLAELVQGGVDAARNYATFGTTFVEEEHIKRRAKELEARERKLNQETEALKKEALAVAALEEQSKLEIAEAQKSADEANARAESLGNEVDKLRNKADLFDQVVSLLTQVLDLPGVGKIARKVTSLWNKLEKCTVMVFA